MSRPKPPAFRLAPEVRDAAVIAAAQTLGISVARALTNDRGMGRARPAGVAAAVALADLFGLTNQQAGDVFRVGYSALSQARIRPGPYTRPAVAAARAVIVAAGVTGSDPRPPSKAPRRPRPSGSVYTASDEPLAAFPDPTARGDCAKHLARVEAALGEGVRFPVLPFADHGPKVAGPWA